MVFNYAKWGLEKCLETFKSIYVMLQWSAFTVKVQEEVILSAPIEKLEWAEFD